MLLLFYADVDVVIVVEIVGGVDDVDPDDNIDIGSVSRESAHLYSGTSAKKKLAKKPVLEDLCSWKKYLNIAGKFAVIDLWTSCGESFWLLPNNNLRAGRLLGLHSP